MEPNEQRPSGLISSLRHLADAVISTLRNRVELLGVELEEEKARLVTTLLWAGAAIFSGLLFVLLFTATVVFLCPEEARLYALIGFTLVYLFLFISAAASLRRQLRDRRPPFADSVSELKKDLSWIRSQE